MTPISPGPRATPARPPGYAERGAVPRLVGDALLSRGLRYGLLVLYAGAVYTLVVTAGGIDGARVLPPGG